MIRLALSVRVPLYGIWVWAISCPGSMDIMHNVFSFFRSLADSYYCDFWSNMARFSFDVLHVATQKVVKLPFAKATKRNSETS